MQRPTVVISRSIQCGGAGGIEGAVARLCAARGWDVLIVPDLYHLPQDDPVRAELADIDRTVALVCSLHPRPAAQLLRDCGVEPLTVVDLRACADAHEAFEALDLPGVEGTGRIRVLAATVGERWYPVIDRDRCVGCRACLQFCLFGVYEVDDAGQVVVAQPDKCKPGCPACSRICPEGAIIFPLSDEPAIAGAPGTLMRPDATARRMFYVRSGRRCPVCGEVTTGGDAPEQGATACPECGRALDARKQLSAVHDDIDALIDTLDELADGGPR